MLQIPSSRESTALGSLDTGDRKAHRHWYGGLPGTDVVHGFKKEVGQICKSKTGGLDHCFLVSSQQSLWPGKVLSANNYLAPACAVLFLMQGKLTSMHAYPGWDSLLCLDIVVDLVPREGWRIIFFFSHNAEAFWCPENVGVRCSDFEKVVPLF